MNRPTLLAVCVLAILLIAVGAIWILQGIKVRPGSFMTEQMKWASWPPARNVRLYGYLTAIDRKSLQS
jgi:hypothetical protein